MNNNIFGNIIKEDKYNLMLCINIAIYAIPAFLWTVIGNPVLGMFFAMIILMGECALVLLHCFRGYCIWENK